ncbi:extracellular solute-binding protein [Arthrobacter sp. H5]|uniref:ABC transporter substrate-binding protein n=1 Tax=Arthrobacter sp. H5 TaxID=1267973 RepID=UPI0004840E73|nr:extracellular solute-binding protein [Arthrobacter sp. H5]
MRNLVSRTALRLGAGAIAGVLLLPGCSAGPAEETAQEPASQEEIDKALETPTELTFWTWVPDIEKEVALFEKEYPAIDVKVVNAGQGAPHYQKLRTAIESGEGAPDVVQMEYQYIDSFTLTDSLLDLAPYGASDISVDYSEWVWNQVARGEAVYGIPQDSGPMGNLYRKDILEKAGVTEPAATWEQYAKDAEAVREKTDAYISNLAPNQAGQALGLLWQAGLKPFGYDGEETVTVNVNDERAKEVMRYWQDLIERDLISTDPDFTDQWYQGLANGKYAGWLTAAWGPVFLQGTAGETSGLWRAAELPQYSEGESVSGNWGGSSDAVLKSTENPVAAYELAKWINHDKSSTMMLATEQFLFPTHTEVLSSPEFLDDESEFYGGQKVNGLFSEVSETVDTEFEWLPYMDFAYSSYSETVGKAIADKGDLAAGLDAWQEQLTAYGKDQGFTIK